MHDEEAGAVGAGLPVDPGEVATAWKPGALAARRHALGGEPLAALAAPAADDLAATARAHAGAEPVRAGALSLLGLVGPLQGSALAGAAFSRAQGRASIGDDDGASPGRIRSPMAASKQPERFLRDLRRALPARRGGPFDRVYDRGEWPSRASQMIWARPGSPFARHSAGTCPPRPLSSGSSPCAPRRCGAVS